MPIFNKQAMSSKGIDLLFNLCSDEWKKINKEILKLTQKPHISLALREETLKEQMEIKKKTDLVLNEMKRKQNQLNSLETTYKFMLIQYENWWDAKIKLLNEQIDGKLLILALFQ